MPSKLKMQSCLTVTVTFQICLSGTNTTVQIGDTGKTQFAYDDQTKTVSAAYTHTDPTGDFR